MPCPSVRIAAVDVDITAPVSLALDWAADANWWGAARQICRHQRHLCGRITSSVRYGRSAVGASEGRRKSPLAMVIARLSVTRIDLETVPDKRR